METIGFVGLGVMGRPMAVNLLKAGYTVAGYDINTVFTAEFVQAGGHVAASLQELAGQATVFITLLPSPAISLDVALGHEGLVHHAKPQSLYLEMSALAPQTAKHLQQGLAAHEIRMLDAPVFDDESKAVDGTLAIMAGGEAEDYQRALPMLEVMGSTVSHVGPVGAGNLTKLANQLIVAVNIAAVAEALALAARADMDPSAVFEAIRHGMAASAVMEAKAPMMLDRDTTPGARLDRHMKDLANVLDTAHELHAPVPLTALVMEMMQALKAQGLGEMDHSALVRYYEMLGHLQVRRGA